MIRWCRKCDDGEPMVRCAATINNGGMVFTYRCQGCGAIQTTDLEKLGAHITATTGDAHTLPLR